MTKLLTHPLQMEDIKPEPATFKLKSRGESEYRLRAVTLEDEIWLNKEFGSRLDNVFKNMEMGPISRIVFRLMDEEDKQRDFTKRKVTIMNEAGETISEDRGGVELLQASLVGFDDKLAVITALLATIGMSRPAMDKLQAALDEAEKKSLSPEIGEKPSTSSQPSTDGQPSTHLPAL